MARRIVFVTQQVDPGHPALGATVAKVRALAALVDELVVLADSAVPGVLPENCRVRTFRAGTRVGRGARFAAALARELPRLHGGAVVAHMCPIYAVLAAPLVRPFRIPLLLWFTHWKASRLLRAAERVSTAVVSVDTRSFPLPSEKIRPIGHGVDVSEFPCIGERPEERGIRVLALGRYSEAKGVDTIVRAVASVPGARLQTYGPTLSDGERATRRALHELVYELGVADRVHLGDAVPRGEIAGVFAAHDVLVNNMRAGAPDKVVYEAAASCLPVLASNPVFDGVLDPAQRFVQDDPDDLAGKIRAFAAMPAAGRARIGEALRVRVRESHSVESWARGVLDAAGAR